MARNIPPTPTRSRKGGATPKVTLMINQLETLKTEIFSMQVLSLPSNSALFSHYEASLTCNFSDSVTSTSCIPNGKNSQRLKIIRGMRSVGREGRSIDLKMFFCRTSCSCNFCGCSCGYFLTTNIFLVFVVLYNRRGVFLLQ